MGMIRSRRFQLCLSSKILSSNDGKVNLMMKLITKTILTMFNSKTSRFLKGKSQILNMLTCWNCDIWKRKLHSENTLNVFRSHNAGVILKRSITTVHFGFECAENLVGKNHVIIVTSSLIYSGFKCVCEELRFRDGLAWRISVTD